jgi:hypothetical protein
MLHFVGAPLSWLLMSLLREKFLFHDAEMKNSENKKAEIKVFVSHVHPPL